MFEAPWRHSGQPSEVGYHWSLWLLGWAWSIAGLLLGAVVAPSIVQFTGLSGFHYQDILVIGIAVLVGFIVQVIGWALVEIVIALDLSYSLPITISRLLFNLAVLLPLCGVALILYRYFNEISLEQRTAAVAFVGGLLVKTVAIPLIKAILTGAAFGFLMRWLRGGKDKSK
jgi:hypothetical protein